MLTYKFIPLDLITRVRGRFMDTTSWTVFNQVATVIVFNQNEVNWTTLTHERCDKHLALGGIIFHTCVQQYQCHPDHQFMDTDLEYRTTYKHRRKH